MDGSMTRSRKTSKDTKKQMKIWKWGHNNPNSVGHRERGPKRESQSVTGLYKKKKNKKSINKQSNFTLKGTWKRTTNKTQTEWKEGNDKDQSRNKQNQVLKNDTKDQWIQ